VINGASVVGVVEVDMGPAESRVAQITRLWVGVPTEPLQLAREETV